MLSNQNKHLRHLTNSSVNKKRNYHKEEASSVYRSADSAANKGLIELVQNFDCVYEGCCHNLCVKNALKGTYIFRTTPASYLPKSKRYFDTLSCEYYKCKSLCLYVCECL